MPRSVSPQRWEKYWEALRMGYSKTDAGRIAGVSKSSWQSFHRGDPGSSGVRWLRARRGEGVVGGDERLYGEPEVLVAENERLRAELSAAVARIGALEEQCTGVSVSMRRGCG